MTGRPRIPFDSRIDKSGDCWIWTGARDSNGYGYASETGAGPPVRAHRYAWVRANGPIPNGMCLDHLCRNPSCVRVEHLELVTPAENVRRGLRGVLRTHCKHGHELTPDNLVRGWWLPPNARRCLTCRMNANRRFSEKRQKAA